MKWVLGAGAVVVLSVAAGLLYLVRNKIEDVSATPALQPFLHKALLTQRPAEIWVNDLGTRLVAKPEGTVQGVTRTDIPLGTPLTVRAFQTEFQQLSGNKYLNAVGRLTVNGTRYDFVYQWSRIPAAPLPRAPWQSESDVLIQFP